LSRLGHLSNEDLAEWIRDGFDGVAQYLVLTHLSQRANNPYLARFAPKLLYRNALHSSGDTQVTLSFPKEPTPWIEV